MSRISKNILYNLIGQALVVLLGFWGTRLVYRRLGDEALGILYFAIALNAVLAPLLDVGVSSTIVREVARRLGAERDYVLRLVRTSSLFYWSAYGLLGILTWISAPWLVSRWIHLKTLDTGLAAHTLRLLALALLLMLPRSLYSNLLRGVERMELNNLVDVGMTALRQGGTIVVVIMGGGLAGIAYLYLGCFLLNILAYLFAAARFFPWRSFLPGFSSDVVRQNFSFTSRVGAYSMLAIVHMESDKVIMSKLLPVSLLGFYGVAQSTVVRVNQIPGAVVQAAFPKLAALFHERDRTGFLWEYRRLQDLVCYGTVPVFAALIFASRPLFGYLLNTRAAELLFLPTLLLCVGWYMNATLNLPAVVSLAADRPDIGARQNFYALFVVLPLTAFFIWKWSLIGAGLSFICYNAFAYAYGARRVASECLGIRPQAWYFHIVKVLAVASATYGIAWFALALIHQESIPALLLAYLFASFAFACGAYLAVGKELRDGLGAMRERISAAALTFSGSQP